MKFEELDISDGLLDALDCMGFETCAPIQEQAIPLALEGRDLIAIAQTGTGKTAAYLLPIIDMLANDGYPQDKINCIIMSPTRELAQQIDRQMEGFSYYMPVTSIAVYGGGTGEEFGRQQHGLKHGADVVIATPGRLLAHLAGGGIDLSQVSFFVLDEADRMLDMGFFDDIMQIERQLPKDRQTLLFSATMPPKIQELASNILRDPAEVKIAVSRPADKIDQSAYICGDGQKTAILEHLVASEPNGRIIVFAGSKLKVKDLARSLRRRGLPVGEMHSDLEQEARDETMLGFKSGRIRVMIATDIVSRGIDIDDIAMVVNYDVPRSAEDYVHRVGRTARAGTDGKAVTLVSGDDRRRFAAIEHFLGKQVRKNPLPDGMDDEPERPSRDGKRGRRGAKPTGKTAAKTGGRPKKQDKPKSKAEQKPEKEPEQQSEPKGNKADALAAMKRAAAGNATADTVQTVGGDQQRRRHHRGGRRHRKNPEAPKDE